VLAVDGDKKLFIVNVLPIKPQTQPITVTLDSITKSEGRDGTDPELDDISFTFSTKLQTFMHICTSGTAAGYFDVTWVASDSSMSPATADQSITVVEVDYLEYKLDGVEDAEWTRVEESDTIYVIKGQKVEFRAVPYPGEDSSGSGGVWPASKPVWSGTSGTTGTGVDEVSATFGTTSSKKDDYKTAIAECGSEKTANVIVFKITLITPAGDPVSSPVNSGDGQNEFTYSGENLFVYLKAKVEPSGVASIIEDESQFIIGDIEGSNKEWMTRNDGYALADGDDLIAVAVFNGLPQRNDQFGEKEASIQYKRIEIDKNKYEVFYSKYEWTNPGKESPNWYYYWKQTSANKGEHGFDYTTKHVAVTSSSPPYRFRIGSGSAEAYPTLKVGANANQNLNGIDTFAWVTRHEYRHQEQLSGWWGIGGRIAELDLDRDLIPDNLEATIPASEGGPYDPTLHNTYPHDDPRLTNDLERHCVFTQEPWDIGSANREDWGSPGMNHQTVDDPTD
jgi:hypothetical protein